MIMFNVVVINNKLYLYNIFTPLWRIWIFMRTREIFPKAANQDLDSGGLDTLSDTLKSRLLELRKNIEAIAEAYEAKAQQLLNKANGMRGWVNTVCNEDSPSPKNEESLVDCTRIAEEKADISGLVKAFVKNFDRNKTFTCHDVMRSIKSQTQIKNGKNIMRRVAGILGHLAQNRSIFSTKKGNNSIYSFPAKTVRPRNAILFHNVLRAIESLEKIGSKVTTKAIRSFLVSDGLFTYENLTHKKVAGSITFLKLLKGFVSVKSKTGNETTYELTITGRAALENLKNKNVFEKKSHRSNET